MQESTIAEIYIELSRSHKELLNEFNVEIEDLLTWAKKDYIKKIPLKNNQLASSNNKYAYDGITISVQTYILTTLFKLVLCPRSLMHTSAICNTSKQVLNTIRLVNYLVYVVPNLNQDNLAYLTILLCSSQSKTISLCLDRLITLNEVLDDTEFSYEVKVQEALKIPEIDFTKHLNFISDFYTNVVEFKQKFKELGDNSMYSYIGKPEFKSNYYACSKGIVTFIRSSEYSIKDTVDTLVSSLIYWTEGYSRSTIVPTIYIYNPLLNYVSVVNVFSIIDETQLSRVKGLFDFDKTRFSYLWNREEHTLGEVLRLERA